MEDRVHKDEISIKQLIQTLLKNWKAIVASTVILTILGGLYVILGMKTKYESRISGTYTIQGTVTNKYGTFAFPTNNKLDFLMIAKSDNVLNEIIKDLGLDTSAGKLNNSIDIEYNDKLSSFSFLVTAEDPDKAKTVAEKLSEAFTKELKLLYKERALEYFLNAHTISMQSNEEEIFRLQKKIEDSQKLLETIEPTVTLKKLLLSDPLYASIIASEKNVDLDDLSEEMAMEEVINPNYQALQDEVIELIKQLNDLYYTQERSERFVTELNEEKEKLLSYRSAGGEPPLTDGSLDVIGSQILMDAAAYLPESPVSSHKTRILLLSVMLGAMIGIFFVFSKAAWKNEFKK